MPLEDVDENGDPIPAVLFSDTFKVIDNSSAGLIIQDNDESNPKTYLTFNTTDGSEQLELSQKFFTGTSLIQGSNFDIDGGTVRGITSFQYVNSPIADQVLSTDESGNATWITNVSANGVAGIIQLSDGAGLFTSDASFSYSAGTMNVTNVEIAGDLNVTGTTTTVSQTNLAISNTFITTNDGETGAGVTGNLSGIEVDRGSLTNFRVAFRESDDKLVAGNAGSEHPVAQYITLTDQQLIKYDTASDKLVSTNTPEVSTLKTTKIIAINDLSTSLIFETTTNKNYMTFNTSTGFEEITVGQKLNMGIKEITGSNFNITDGTAILSAFKLTTSPTVNYVLTSDANGNASWQQSNGSAGSSQRVQFSAGGGAFASNSAFKFNTSSGLLSVPSVTISGDLIVQGTTTTVNNNAVTTTEVIITINDGEVGAGMTAPLGGIEIDRGSETNYQLVFRESDAKWTAGELGSLKVLASIEDTPTDGGFAVWNNTTGVLETTTAPSFVDPIISGDVTFTDNNNAGLRFISGGNTYLTFDSADGAEQIILGQILATGNTAVTGSNFNITGGDITGLSSLQLVTGATSGYLATSDGSGNVSWVAPTSIPIAGWTDAGGVIRLDTLTDNVAIGSTTTSGTEKLRVTGGAVLFDDTTGTVPVSGAGTRFMWVPSKASLRAGATTGTQWDTSNVGDYSTAFGLDTIAAGEHSTALGFESNASRQGQLALANGKFATIGDGQGSFIVFKASTSNNTTTEMTLDGAAVGAGNRFVLSTNSTYLFDLKLCARRTDGVDESAGYSIKVVMDRNTLASSTAIVGIRSRTSWASDISQWDIEVTADTTNGSIKIDVTGETAKTIRWVCFATVVEVSA
jgi:hypothetical protein